MPIRILLVDDHALVRQGLRSLLEREGFSVVGEASDGLEALDQVRALAPDIVVMDISMPSQNGLNAAREIKKVWPDTKVILLTQHTEDMYIADALEASVSGYVLKSQASSDLVHAIQQVSDGKVYISPGISGAVLTAYKSRTDNKTDTLTLRERQVLQLIAEGKSTRDVASLLFISVKTAETHRSRLMQKLDIHETAGLVRYAIRRGLVQP
ncbi:MAG TPA: response regulator transcription factor [Candidatus Dormibacteraeota bacterium]|jgi:two-component system response regulator NreC|nr:response regulator transcription factor [Candidatus Dormibacteraeota bacterium]